MEKLIIPNPICPNGYIYLSDAAAYLWSAFRLYIEPLKYYTICKPGSK